MFTWLRFTIEQSTTLNIVSNLKVPANGAFFALYYIQLLSVSACRRPGRQWFKKLAKTIVNTLRLLFPGKLPICPLRPIQYR